MTYNIKAMVKNLMFAVKEKTKHDIKEKAEKEIERQRLKQLNALKKQTIAF